MIKLTYATGEYLVFDTEYAAVLELMRLAALSIQASIGEAN